MTTAQPPDQQINVQFTPEVTRGIYSNSAVISHTPMDFVFDFIQVSQPMGEAHCRARIITPPAQAKSILTALAANVAKYEARFGNIEIVENPLPMAAPEGEAN